MSMIEKCIHGFMKIDKGLCLARQKSLVYFVKIKSLLIEGEYRDEAREI